MNKEKFIETIKNETGYDLERCNAIASILDDTFFVGKKNKEKIVSRFNTELKLSMEDSETLYEKVVSVITTELKNKIRHPFGGNKEDK